MPEEVAPLVTVIPLWAVRDPVKVVAPVTPKIPPKVVAPVPTVKVLAPVTEVTPAEVIPPLAVNRPVKVVAPLAVIVPKVPVVEVINGVVTEVEKVGSATIDTVIVSIAPPVVVILVPAAIVIVSPVEITWLPPDEPIKLKAALPPPPLVTQVGQEISPVVALRITGAKADTATVPVALGKLQIRAAVRSTSVKVPEKEAAPPAAGTIVSVSSVPVEVLKIELPVWVIRPVLLKAPLLVIPPLAVSKPVNVVAPVTPSVEENVVAPVTPKVPPIVVLPPTVTTPVPKKLKLGLVIALPKDMFSKPFVVFMFR